MRLQQLRWVVGEVTAIKVVVGEVRSIRGGWCVCIYTCVYIHVCVYTRETKTNSHTLFSTNPPLIPYITQQPPKCVFPIFGPEVGVPYFMQRAIPSGIEELPQIFVEVGIEFLHQQLTHDFYKDRDPALPNHLLELFLECLLGHVWGFGLLPLHPRAHAARLLGFFWCRKRSDVLRIGCIIKRHLHLACLILVIHSGEHDVTVYARLEHAEVGVAELLDTRHL